jgi:linoleate 10R-lipoxygenase
MKDLGRLREFTWKKPARVPQRINVTSYEGVMAVLKDADNFKFASHPLTQFSSSRLTIARVTWAEGLGFLMGKPGLNFMLSGDGPFFAERRQMMSKCLYQEGWKAKIRQFYEETTVMLLKKWSYKVGGVNQVDIIRDIGNSGMHESKARKEG